MPRRPSLVPSPYPVAHIGQPINSTDLDPDTGNPLIVRTRPVIRWAQGFSEITKRGSSRTIYSTETVRRVDTELHMAVDDPTVYNPQDDVLLFPNLDDCGEYVQGTGVAFLVVGLPINDKLGPWPGYLKMFGGLVRLRRVT